jgi:proton-dependent oligopeptide transporter, POT family
MPTNFVPPPTGDRKLFGHPPGLFLLFTVEMWERFSFYGMRAMLMLYLVAFTVAQQHEASQKVIAQRAATQTMTVTHSAGTPLESGATAATSPSVIEEFRPDDRGPGRGLSKPDAGNIYGWYAGMGYLLSMIGGIIADKFLGQHRSMLAGGILIALGHTALGVSGFGSLNQSSEGLAIFIFGLALLVLGTGQFKPNVSVMVDRLYPPGDIRRDGAFTVFYMGVNTGAFIGPLVCGWLAHSFGWHFGFGAAAVGMIAGICTYLFGRRKLLGNIGAAPVRTNYAPALVVICIVLAALIATLFYTNTLGMIGSGFDAFVGLAPWTILSIFVLLILGGCYWFVSIQPRADRGPVSVILVFVLFNAIFWLAFEQAGTSLNLFAETFTRRTFFGYEVPAEWFQSIGAIMVVTLAPIFAALWVFLSRRNLNPGQPMKLALGLMLVGLGYVFMVFGSLGTSEVARASAFWLTATYFTHTVGELCISPTGLSFVAKNAPLRFSSFLMGVFFLSNAVANKVGGQVAGQIERVASGEVKLPWHLGGQADFFLFFVVLSVAAGLVVLIFVPVLNRLLRRSQPQDSDTTSGPKVREVPIEP